MTALLEDRGVAEPIQSYYEAPVFRRQVDWTPAGRRARIPDCCGPTETRTFGTSFRMARGREELHAAMRLVHDSYVRLGFIRPNRHGLHVIPYHVLPTTDVLVAVRRGEVVALWGPSGAGKSTFLTSVGLITPLTSGRVAIGGKLILDGPYPRANLQAFRRKHIGYVFQKSNLIPFLTAYSTWTGRMYARVVHIATSPGRKRSIALR